METSKYDEILKIFKEKGKHHFTGQLDYQELNLRDSSSTRTPGGLMIAISNGRLHGRLDGGRLESWYLPTLEVYDG